MALIYHITINSDFDFFKNSLCYMLSVSLFTGINEENETFKNIQKKINKRAYETLRNFEILCFINKKN